jgi:hypothetical protein
LRCRKAPVPGATTFPQAALCPALRIGCQARQNLAQIFPLRPCVLQRLRLRLRPGVASAVSMQFRALDPRSTVPLTQERPNENISRNSAIR